ncbi:hypothetical protein CVS37_29120 [Burkholderia lata]|nr:hypothetical protein CVS37_29120 [Burkholderia lata]
MLKAHICIFSKAHVVGKLQMMRPSLTLMISILKLRLLVSEICGLNTKHGGQMIRILTNSPLRATKITIFSLTFLNCPKMTIGDEI